MAKKVLYISSALSFMSGASHSLLSLVEQVREFGIEPIVLFASRGEAMVRFEEAGIETVAYPFYNKICRKRNVVKTAIKSILNERTEKFIQRLVKEKGIDLIHINGSTTYIGGKAAKKVGIPYIVHFREFLEEDLLLEYANPREAYSMLTGASSVISVSNAVADYVNEKYPPLREKNNVVYNGVPIPSSFQIRQPSEQITFSILGRVFPKKGQLEAALAFAELKKETNLPMKLQIVGFRYDENYIQEIENALREIGVEDSVVFIDHTNDLEEIWENTNIGLVCSANEAFGRVSIEFMAHSILVIGSNSGGTKELLADGRGWLYEPGSVKDLKSKMLEAVSLDAETKQIKIRKAYEYVKDNCTESIYANNVLSVYQKLFDRV